ncbi:hypothetical protein JX266_009247 [Neoarthrinium moseri]|uniref:uncharacterized protein n=1 Tax=Neoarthrinium moseri TaxID=1658444 RepID=UPI001FDB6DDF|nr:uncharacterized protein JN550_003954 [Neoarthrinium moseri]KAI1844574.1 hypothetical protein JX266_009247 [Neoarthrinium moseri]KAI1872235.1 hypothetical protein JN550_003954 [Neoarthrinium moseri]
MKGTPVDQLVYEYMFPKPRSTDPQNFHSLLHRHLILEVRQEVHAFYGHLDTQEAKYPGLDYCHHIHRIRLSRWAWHRRLFRAFDGLRLTRSEISNLTKWEGTKWAKERFERDSGIFIRDTAPEEVGQWIEPEDRPQALRATLRAQMLDDQEDDQEEQDAADDDMDGEEESDGELNSIGIALNQRLLARREAGDISEPLDEEWEQWLKNAIDSGALPFLTENLRHSTDPAAAALVPQALFPPRMLSAARAGQWDEVPEFLHDMLRRTLQTEAATAATPSMPEMQGSARSARDILNIASWRRSYSDLRLPIGDGPTNTSSDSVRYNRTARPGA